MSHNEQEDLFSQAMSEVQALKQCDKVKPVHKKRPRLDSLLNKQGVVDSAAYHDKNNHFSTNLNKTATPWVLCANGISSDNLKKLAQGQPPIDQHLDLHGMNREQALSQLEQCLQHSITCKHRVLCVIHGRGNHSKDGVAILKESVYQSLADGFLSHHILAVIPRPQTAGGSCLILIRRDKQ